MLCRFAGGAGLVAAGGGRAAWSAIEPKPVVGPSLPVAIQKCAGYDRKLLAERLDNTLDLIGGIGSLVRGKTVTVKLNLTGEPKWKLAGLPSFRTYHVHPNVVAALCSRLKRDGAKRIILVESYYLDEPPETILADAGWDIEMIRSAGDHTVTFEDTRNRGDWPKYSRLPVPWGGYLYPAFDLNQRYEKTDTFISLAKLKDHANAGVTLSIKNLFGIAPTALYGNDAPNEKTLSNRGKVLHTGERSVPAGVPAELDAQSPRHWSYRVPRATADLIGARPVDLAIIDGVETNRGGEGPWIKGVQPLQPHLLLAGKNPLCTDAIAAAAMGYDPTVADKTFPFPGDNHLSLLAKVGVGTHDPKRIEVRGVPIRDALYPFNPKKRKVGEPIF
jgi:uncharacterized protein (DUF362 family)